MTYFILSCKMNVIKSTQKLELEKFRIQTNDDEDKNRNFKNIP